MRDRLKNYIFRIWYWYISKVDKNADFIFMNYGYSKDKYHIKLDKNDEKNRYSAQLYDFVAQKINITGKDVLEVGCGRGGGLSYINRYYSPNSVTGVDLNKKAVEFCKSHYSKEDISFLQSNAQDLKFPDSMFDVVINVESSHRYNRMDLFLQEVYRVLRPNGVFLFADFRLASDIDNLNKQFKLSGLKFAKDENITENVLEALRLTTTEREDLIQKVAPKFFHSLGKKFAATEGTPTYNKFLFREFEYVFYQLVK